MVGEDECEARLQILGRKALVRIKQQPAIAVMIEMTRIEFLDPPRESGPAIVEYADSIRSFPVKRQPQRGSRPCLGREIGWLPPLQRFQ